MSYVVRLVGFRPSPRDDGVAWTQVRVEEAATQNGPWTVIDTQALSPVDPDPTVPQIRNVTTSGAQLASGWYRLAFVDPAGGQQLTGPVAGSGAGIEMPPSASVVRDRSELLTARYPPNPVDGDVERRLRELVADAVALIESITGRVLDSTLPTVPVNLVRIAMRATALMSEMMSVRGSLAYAQSTADGSRQRLKSISAGSWSESYFGPGELVVKAGIVAITGNQALDEALWALMTDEKRDEWRSLATGVRPAAGRHFEVDWGGGAVLGPIVTGSGIDDGWV